MKREGRSQETMGDECSENKDVVNAQKDLITSTTPVQNVNINVNKKVDQNLKGGAPPMIEVIANTTVVHHHHHHVTHVHHHHHYHSPSQKSNETNSPKAADPSNSFPSSSA